MITRLIVGGAQENTLSSVLGLRAKPGVDVRLVSGPSAGPEGSLEARAAKVPGLLHKLPTLVRPVHPWLDLRAYRELCRLFRSERPDVVHTHSGKAGILGRLAAHRAGVPVIIHTIHGPSFGPFQGPIANALFCSAERLAGKYTTHFVSVAEAMTRQYLAAGIGQPSQYTRIFSGFNLAPFRQAANDPALRARWGLGPEDIVVGKIARLFQLKGHDDLLSAAPAILRQCPRVKFLLVGDGAWRQRPEEKARALGISQACVFTGLVSPEEIPALVGIMDLLVHLSRREGLPRALPQALAAGRPVIAYDCDGASEVCRHEATGLLLPPGTDITESVLRLARNPELRRQLGERGHNFVLAHFSEPALVDALHTLYCRLLGKPC